MTITANRWGWRHSLCVLVCRRHIPEMAWENVNELQRGQKGCRIESPERSEEEIGGGAEAPLVAQALSVPQGPLLPLYMLTSVLQPHLLCYCPCEWGLPLWWADRPGVLREISSCHLLSLLRHSSTVGKPGIRQLPAILCSDNLPPPFFCPYGLFSGRTPAVSYNYRFAGLLLTPGWTPRSGASLFYRH